VTDILPSLDAIQARADAATEGPWDDEDCEGELSVRAGTAITQWKTLPSGTRMGTPASSWKSSDLIAEWDLDTWDWGEDPNDDQRRQDAEFIAAARTDVPALVAALRAALALHRGGAEVLGYDEEGVYGYVPACVECGHAVPCPTVRAVTAHIDTTPKEDGR